MNEEQTALVAGAPPTITQALEACSLDAGEDEAEWLVFHLWHFARVAEAFLALVDPAQRGDAEAALGNVRGFLETAPSDSAARSDPAQRPQLRANFYRLAKLWALLLQHGAAGLEGALQTELGEVERKRKRIADKALRPLLTDADGERRAKLARLAELNRRLAGERDERERKEHYAREQWEKGMAKRNADLHERERAQRRKDKRIVTQKLQRKAAKKGAL